MCLTVFGKPHGAVSAGPSLVPSAAEIPDVSTKQSSKRVGEELQANMAKRHCSQDSSLQQSGDHLGFEGSPEQEYEQGFPPKGVAKHGPQFLSLTREEKGWLKRVHHRMGHPDPIRFAKFPKETHADPHVVARRFSV